jgi:hypothetical protein
VPPQERGTHRTLTSGTTAQPSCLANARMAGIHISACESPKTMIVFAAPAAPSRQTLLDVPCREGVQPSGNV